MPDVQDEELELALRDAVRLLNAVMARRDRRKKAMAEIAAKSSQEEAPNA